MHSHSVQRPTSNGNITTQLTASLFRRARAAFLVISRREFAEYRVTIVDFPASTALTAPVTPWGPGVHDVVAALRRVLRDFA